MCGLRRQVMIFSKHVNSTADQNIKKTRASCFFQNTWTLIPYKNSDIPFLPKILSKEYA